MACACSTVSSPTISRDKALARVDFYQLTRDPVDRVLAVLAAKVLGDGGRLYVVAAELELRMRLDRELWAGAPASFLPHAIDGAPDAADEPVLIGAALPNGPANGARLVALADGVWREEALGFERTFYLFDNQRIDDARAAWRALARSDRATTHFWKQDMNGRWSEGP